MLLLFTVARHASSADTAFPWIVACAAAAGVLQPPLTVLTRALWRHRFDDEVARKRAFAVDSVMIELNFSVGPMFAALLLAAGHS